jgi:acyl transferase domain-containing protein/NADPH:quinone reductase-like Zn-dependent oxidoreductase
MNTPLSPLKQAFLAIEELQAKLDAAEQAKNAPIAVIGIGCRLPGGANDPEMFWQNLKNGVDGIRDVPADRWSVETFYDPDPNTPGKTYVRQAGFIDQVDGFDPQFFGIAPREAHAMDPQQRLLLEVAWEALENAGIAPDSLAGSQTGVFVGIASSDYASLFIKTNDLSHLDAYYGSGISHSIASGRLSYILGLLGPSISLDTACSSSLVAAHLAVQSLRNKESDLALACGVNLILLPDNQISFSKLRMLALDGRCKTFDARADGFGDGEGCGVVVLKRLVEAIADGDRILAVIRGTAIGQDGASSGLTAPNGPSQEAVIRAALANGGIRPHEVGYIEAHGTGTSLGDPIEVQAAAAVLRQGRPVDRPFYLGSVKTNVGHLEAGAGITGLIKAVLMVQHGEIPPHLNYATPNPLVDWDEVPALISTVHVPWPVGYESRIAGVSAFGFSGTNAHMLVEEPPQEQSVIDTQNDDRPLHIFTLSARDDAALQELAGRYGQFLADLPVQERLPDIAYTANTGRAKLPMRLAILAENAAQVVEKISAYQEKRELPGLILGNVPGGDPPRVAFLFTGQGAQYVGMGRILYDTQPIFREAFDRCDEILRPMLGDSLVEILYPDFPSPHDPQTLKMDNTKYTQPAIFAFEFALAKLWISWGILPSAVMGHSVGEYVAAVLAGVFSLEDGLKLIAARGRLMGALPEGGSMAAVFAPVDRVQPLLTHPLVSLAALNSPENTVISGDSQAVQAILDGLKAQGIKSRMLKVSHAFHSPLIEPMLDEFERVASEITYFPPRIRLISDVTGEISRGTQVANARYWREHVRQPVQFMHSVETLFNEGCDIFLEVGPSPTLTSLGQRILVEPDRPVTWVHSLKQNQDDLHQMLTGLGTLFTHGLSADWEAFDRPYRRQKLALPTYPFQRSRYWVNFKPKSITPLYASERSHPLLGHRLRSPANTVSFENSLSTTGLSFLNDHRVYGMAILPGTAFIEMGIAAASEYFGTGFHSLEEITIHEALIVGDNDQRLLHVLISPDLSGTTPAKSARLEIFTQGEPTDPWLLHASGLIRSGDGSKLVEPASLADIQNRCSDKVSAEAHYRRLADSGLNFGDSLKGLELIFCHPGEALAKINPTQAVVAETGYVIHPALLDAHLQAMAAALPANQAVYLPMHFEKIQRLSDALPVWCHVKIEAADSGLSGRETVRANLSLMDDAANAVITITGIILKRAERSALQKNVKDGFADWLYETSWIPASDRLLAQQPALESNLSPGQISDQLAPTFDRLFEQNGLDEYVTDLLPEFNRLSQIYISNALLKLGWQPQVGLQFTTDSLADQLRIIPQHQRLLGYLLGILSEDAFLRRDGNLWEVMSVPRLEDAQILHSTLMKLYPQYEGELEITGRCGALLAEALTGVADPLQLLFPGGGQDIAEKIYIKSPAAKTYNGLIGSVIETVVAARAAVNGNSQSPLRVLEIGAGTGGTTSYVLPVLPADRTEYTYTDISPLFTARAKQKFNQYPFVTFQPLDIEKDPDEQGLKGQQFDLVIAANVIHATQDLRTTLAHVRKHLAPGGLFIMLEVTAPQRWVDITFGLTDGWWRFIDKDLRPTYPLLARQQWIDLLQSMGFGGAATIPHARALGENLPIEEAVIIASKPSILDDQASLAGTWLVIGNRDGLGSKITKELTDSGSVCVFREPELDEIPLLVKQTLPLKGVIHLGDTRSALSLVQALITSDGVPPRLWLVTIGAQPAGGLAEPDPAQAELWGFGKVVALEHPELRCMRVDLDPAEPNPEKSLLSEIVYADGSTENEEEIALRGTNRLVARLTRYTSPTPTFLPRRSLSISQRGALDSLVWKPFEPGKPGPGEVEIRVQATGLNFKDLMIALDMYPGGTAPMGSECTGVISAVGDGVIDLQIGDPVMAIASGSFSTHVIVSTDFVIRRPLELGVEQAASVLVPYITADFALNHLGKMQAGDKVLIHAGAGGVGLAAIQLAQQVGAEIFASAGNPEKRAYLQSIGVHHVLDSRSLEFADEVMRITGGKGVNLVLNSLAGEFIPKSLGVLADHGRFLEIGKSGLLTSDQAAGLGRGIQYFIIDWTEEARSVPELIHGIMKMVVSDLAAGVLRPLPTHLFPVEETIDAFRFMQQARHIGKIIINQPADSSLPVIRSDASYLVTGGLRGLGLLTAEWLVEQGARHLALLGRNPAAGSAVETLRKLESIGANILVIQGDVSVEADVQLAFDQIREKLPPLRGVIHSAGQLDDASLVNQTWNHFKTVYAPKVLGASLLHRATQGLALDFFVIYSSIASLFGSRGQANHAAANAFLDALAYSRRSQGLPALSINWGMWAEVGAAAERGTIERTAGQGIHSIPPQTGLKILEQMIRSQAIRVGVSPMSWPEFLQGYGKQIPASFRNFVLEAERSVAKRSSSQPATGPTPVTSQPEILRQLAEAPADRKRSILLSFVQAQAAKVLGLEKHAVNERTPLNEMGLDSLMAVELRNLLGSSLDLKRPLPVTLVYDYPTVLAINEYLAQEILNLEAVPVAEGQPQPAASPANESAMLESIEDLSDDDVDRLLAEMTKRKQ